MTEKNAGKSLQAALAFSPKDWSQHHRDAWVWGIINGWDSEAMREVAEQHGWSPDTVRRLERLHRQFAEAFGLDDDESVALERAGEKG
jgi:hypothetical protein